MNLFGCDVIIASAVTWLELDSAHAEKWFSDKYIDDPQLIWLN